MGSNPRKSGTKSPASIALGSVVQVYPESRTVDVEVDLSGESDIHAKIPYGTLYTNVVTGTHVDFVPEVGSKCYVLTPSDGTDPVVLCWVSAPLHGAFSKDNTSEPEDNHLGGRLGLTPGDIALYNANGATVILRKGGTLQLGASPLAQTLYLPIDNLIRTFFQNYEATSLLGTLYWKHGTIQTSAEETSAQLYWGMKRDVEDSHVAIRIRAGRAGDPQFSPAQDELFGATRSKPFKFGAGAYSGDPQETTIVSICVDPENTGATYVFQLDTQGNVFIKNSGNLHWEMDSASIYAASGFTIKFGSAGEIAAAADNSLRATVQNLVVEALSGIALSSGTGSCTLTSPAINLGGAAAVEPAVLGLRLLTLLATHEHMPPKPLGTGKCFTGFPAPDWIGQLNIMLSQSVKLLK